MGRGEKKFEDLNLALSTEPSKHSYYIRQVNTNEFHIIGLHLKEDKKTHYRQGKNPNTSETV